MSTLPRYDWSDAATKQMTRLLTRGGLTDDNAVSSWSQAMLTMLTEDYVTDSSGYAQLQQVPGTAYSQFVVRPLPQLRIPTMAEIGQMVEDSCIIRSFGVLQAVGGALEDVGGLGLGVLGLGSEVGSVGTTSEVSIPALAAAGYVLYNGTDNMVAGVRTAWTGAPAATATYSMTKYVTGSEDAAMAVDFGANVLGAGFSIIGLAGLASDPEAGMIQTSARSVSAPRTAESLVTWVDEGGNLRLGGNPGMSPAAYDFQSGTPGARSSLLTGRSQAPYLEFTNEAGQTIGAKYDGVQGLELIDRKLNPFFSAKAVDEATRQAAVARYYDLQAVWELPTPRAVSSANRFMQTNNITGITVRLGQ